MPSHDLDPISLIAGVFFGGSALVFLLDQWAGFEGRWVWPVLLILIGVVGLLASRGKPSAEPDEVQAESRSGGSPVDD